MVSNFKALCGALVLVASADTADAQRDRSAGLKLVENPALWFPPEDYPVDARRAGEQGRVVIGLVIDKTGEGTACSIEVSSGSKLLDDGTCTLALKRARFRPALDRRGHPVAARFLLPVRWQLEGEETELANTTMVAEIDVTPTGAVSACRTLQPVAETLSGPSCGEEFIGELGSLVKDGTNFTLEMRVTIRLGQEPTADQIGPSGEETISLRLNRFLVNELGNVIQCVSLRSIGLKNSIPDCAEHTQSFAPRIGADGKPEPTWVVVGTSLTKRRRVQASGKIGK